MQMGAPDVAMRVDMRTWIGPRWVSKCSFEPSRAAAAEVGYSPPTPTPAMPRAMVRNQSILFAPLTWKTRVARREPMMTRPEVTSMPPFRLNLSAVKPKTRIPITEPTKREFEMRVCVSAV